MLLTYILANYKANYEAPRSPCHHPPHLLTHATGGSFLFLYFVSFIFYIPIDFPEKGTKCSRKATPTVAEAHRWSSKKKKILYYIWGKKRTRTCHANGDGPHNQVLVEHKNSLGRGSFIIFPQLRLLWNPRKREDRRCDIPDIGIGRLTAAGTIHLQGGLEQKPALGYMKNLPPPSDIFNTDSLRTAINKAAVQASDQVKAALKNGCVPCNSAIKWIIACGPYFVIQEFGPYTADDLTTRGHKQNIAATP
jgi:hypothetical protein